MKIMYRIVPGINFIDESTWAKVFGVTVMSTKVVTQSHPRSSFWCIMSMDWQEIIVTLLQNALVFQHREAHEELYCKIRGPV